VPAEKKYIYIIIIITKPQKTGGGADECVSGACARGARERESRKTVQAAATMGRVHPARISFYPLSRGSAAGALCCKLHR